MKTATFQLPIVNSDEEVRKIEATLRQIAGVRDVDGHEPTKIFAVTWDDPATWDAIETALVRIGYSPKYK